MNAFDLTRSNFLEMVEEENVSKSTLCARIFFVRTVNCLDGHKIHPSLTKQSINQRFRKPNRPYQPHYIDNIYVSNLTPQFRPTIENREIEMCT